MTLSQLWASNTGFSDTILYPADVSVQRVDQHIAPGNCLADQKVSVCAPLAHIQHSLFRITTSLNIQELAKL